MCPKEQRESYEDGKESTLVRIILRHRPKEYDSAVKCVMDLHRLRLYAKEGNLGKITNLEDNSRVIYNADWLPNYDELRAALLDSYLLQKRRRDEENKSTKKSPGHPTLPILQGFEQPGSKPKICYGCGEPGHFRGDAECKAGANDVWSGAPESFKQKPKYGTPRPKGKGKGGGKGKNPKGTRQRNLPEKGDKTPCKFFNSGNGYCKWGDNCRHSHDKRKGGKGERKPALLLSRQDKKAKKDLVAMVIKDLKGNLGKRKEKPKEESDDEEIYNLVRGKRTAMMVQRRDDEGDDNYVPQRPQRRVIMMISSGESEDSDYIPKRPSANESTENKNKNIKIKMKVHQWKPLPNQNARQRGFQRA
jgi:hypothetical protein